MEQCDEEISVSGIARLTGNTLASHHWIIGIPTAQVDEGFDPRRERRPDLICEQSEHHGHVSGNLSHVAEPGGERWWEGVKHGLGSGNMDLTLPHGRSIPGL